MVGAAVYPFDLLHERYCLSRISDYSAVTNKLTFFDNLGNFNGFAGSVVAHEVERSALLGKGEAWQPLAVVESSASGGIL